MEGDAPANTLVLALVEGNAEDNSFLQEFIAKDLQCIFRGFDITLPLSVTELCDSSASTSAPSSVEPVAASTSAPSVPAGKSKRKSRALPRVEPVQVNAHNIPHCWCSSHYRRAKVPKGSCWKSVPEAACRGILLQRDQYWKFSCSGIATIPLIVPWLESSS